MSNHLDDVNNLRWQQAERRDVLTVPIAEGVEVEGDLSHLIAFALNMTAKRNSDRDRIFQNSKVFRA